MNPSLIIAGIPFYDAPAEIEGSPYWVDLWTDINGYKIGLQVKPATYHSANMSIYMGGAKSSEEKGHKAFRRDFCGKVFIIEPVNGAVSERIERQIQSEANLLSHLPKRA